MSVDKKNKALRTKKRQGRQEKIRGELKDTQDVVLRRKTYGPLGAEANSKDRKRNTPVHKAEKLSCEEQSTPVEENANPQIQYFIRNKKEACRRRRPAEIRHTRRRDYHKVSQPHFSR